MVHIAALAIVIHDFQIWIVPGLKGEQHEIDPPTVLSEGKFSQQLGDGSYSTWLFGSSM